MSTEVLNILEQHAQRMLHLKSMYPVRPFVKETQLTNSHMLISGPRGTGKTTMLLQEAAKRGNILYLSVDNLIARGYDLMDTADEAFMSGYEGIIVDEVHYEENWGIKLKSLIDLYADKIIWASDSSSLVLRAGMQEIARRAVGMAMPYMSFREYLEMETGISYDRVEDPFGYSPSFTVDAAFLRLFEKYKTEGLRPVYKEGDYQLIAENIVDKIISSDIPFFVPEISSRHVRLMKSIMSYISSSNVPRLETSNLTKAWNVSYEKIVQLLDVMEGVSLISIVPTFEDRKEKLSKSKIFFSDPSLYNVLSGKEGNLREALTVLSFRSAGWEIYASSDEESGDFVVLSPEGQKRMIEVGGRKKRIKASDAVIRDNTDYPAGNIVPLWVLAMMW